MKKILLIVGLIGLLTVQSAFAISSSEYGTLGKYLLGAETNPSGKYGQVHSAWTGIYPGSKHPGVDYSVKQKSVYSVCDGEITNSGGSLGIITVYNKSTNKTYIYMHLSSISVKSGKVKKGQKIGVSGNKSPYKNPLPYHLHFEVRNGKKTQGTESYSDSEDPYYWTKKAR